MVDLVDKMLRVKIFIKFSIPDSLFRLHIPDFVYKRIRLRFGMQVQKGFGAYVLNRN